jgi:arginine-tRNA-protein transferase
MKMRYKYIKNCPESLNAALVKRGWRRFGHYFSRPECGNCNACQSLRVDAENFQPSRSQRRVWRQRGIRTFTRKPTVTYEHLKLYEKYHRYMQQKRGWDYYSVDAESYHDLYVKGYESYGNEVQYYYEGNLVGVDLIDYLDDGISANYFYYDPDFAHLSLGTYSLLKEVEMARERGLKWIYLGYYVADCKSLHYKIFFKPHQILENHPDEAERPVWK